MLLANSNSKKVKILLFLISFVNAEQLFSQPFYVAVDLGYGLGLASHNLASNTTIGLTQTNHSAVTGSFGQGIVIRANVGYQKSALMAFEMGVSYLQSGVFMSTSVKDTSYKQNLALSANMLCIAPSIRFSVGEKKTKLYLKAGLLIKLIGKITNKSTFYDQFNGTVIQTEWKYSKGLSFGASAGLGMIHHFNRKSAIYCEVFFNAQSWGPKIGSVVKYKVNGVDMIESLNPSQRNTHYLNNYSNGGNNSNYNYDQQLRQYFPFSSFGIKFGYQFGFGKNNQQ